MHNSNRLGCVYVNKQKSYVTQAKIKPPALKKGDTIGLISLASPLSESDSAVKYIRYLQGMDFKVVLGKYFWSRNYPIASPEERAADLMSMFTNPNVKMIMPLRGGTRSADVIPFLDYPTIKQNPKLFSGYSDLSLLLNTIHQWTGLITLHGLMLTNFNQDTPSFNYDSFFSTTSTTTAPRIISNPLDMPLITEIPGTVSGPIVGGNISSLIDSLGTPFQLDTRGKILFLEDVAEATSRMYRKLNHLKDAGIFKDCIGIIMGECTNCPIMYNLSYQRIIELVLKPLGKPLLSNAAIGHGKYNITIPIGANVTLNTQSKQITVLESAVSLS